MKFVEDYALQWTEKTPCICPDGGGGSLLILERKTVCMECGRIAIERLSHVWEGTKRRDLIELGYGASVKHYFTSCPNCGSEVIS